MQKNHAPETPYFEHVRPEMLPYVPTDARRILEVGCSSGLFARQLKRTIQAEFWGIELNEEAGRAAQAVFDKVLIGDVTRLLQELPEGHFDCVIFNDVLEHLAYPEDLLVAIKSKLTPRGIIVASIPNVRAVKNLFNLLIKKDWRYESHGILDRTHLRFFTERSLRRTLEETGYRVERCDGINPTRFKLFWLFNVLTLGWASDTRFMNFACVFRPTAR